MADIQSIIPFLFTSSAKDSGTDGDVYLGIGGREFYLDTPHDDFETGVGGYAPVVGVGTAVSHPEMNDPRSPFPLRTQELNRFPVYLRLDGGDHWKISFGAVFVYSGPDAASMQLSDRYYTPFPFTGSDGGLWLGPKAGKWLHLRRSGERELMGVLRKAKLLEVVKEGLPRARPPRRRRKK